MQESASHRDQELSPTEIDALVAACVPGDEAAEAAFKRLYLGLNDTVRTFLWTAHFHSYRRAPDPEVVEDVIVSTFVAVWQGATGFRAESSAKTWILSIARNQMATALKRRARDDKLVERMTRESRATRNPTWAGAEDSILLRLTCQSALSRLPADDQEILRLMYSERRGIRDIAALLGISPTAVKSRLYTARNRLRSFFNEEDGNEGSQEKVVNR